MGDEQNMNMEHWWNGNEMGEQVFVDEWVISNKQFNDMHAPTNEN
jgi:hypothetical protein